MRKKITSLFLSIIMFALMACTLFLAWYLYTYIISEESSDTIIRFESVATENTGSDDGNANRKSGDVPSISQDIISQSDMSDTNNESSINKFFYAQLSENQKIIYDKLNNNKANLMKGNEQIDYGDTFSSILSQENGSEQLGKDYQTAIEAFTQDNVDLFYLDVNKMYLNIETKSKLLKKYYNVYISAGENGNYYADGFSSYEQVSQIMNEIEECKNQILSGLKGNDYQNIMYIHDYLVNNIEYDSTYEAMGSYSLYGALIGKKCVCEGYTKAFKYLTNAIGFECEMMQGDATNNSGKTESHAWNCIKFDGKWYEVDVTWDDPIIIGSNKKLTKDIKYKYFLKGSDFFEQEHFLNGQLTEEGKVFSYPTINKENYK